MKSVCIIFVTTELNDMNVVITSTSSKLSRAGGVPHYTTFYANAIKMIIK